jgi:gliding motility-associated-like protein
MKTTFIFLIVIFPFFINCQNLVPNPGFEDYITPPCYWIGTQSDLSAAEQNWLIQSGSPDIFSTLVASSCFASCSSTEYYSVGHQQPHSGNFMAGIITFGAGMNMLSQYRESYEIQLSSPLITGQKYYTEMYVSLGERSSFATNNIGFYFSEPLIPFDITNTGPLYFTPQINETNVIADTSNWVKISGTFTAESPAEYLIIANFTDDSLTNSFHINQTDFGDAYYFIDDILVKETCLSVCNNKTICKNDSTTITASANSFNGWALADDSETIISTDSIFVVSPLVTTTYLAFSECDTFSVVVTVKTLPPATDLGNDTIICEGQTLTIKANEINGNYEWQDGSSKPSFDAIVSGTYWLNETNVCGTTYSEIKLDVSPLPKINFDVVTLLCIGDSIILDETDPTLETFYYDTLTGSNGFKTIINSAGFYTLRAQNDCGYSFKMISVEMIECPDKKIDCLLEFEMPNVITPNGDLINDLLTPAKIKCIGEMKTTLFNRWGEIIYETSKPTIEWDGSAYTEGVYYWKVEYTDLNSKKIEQKGFFHLVK